MTEIILRTIRYDDLEILNKWKNDKEVYKFLGGGYAPTSIDEQKKWMDQMIDNSGKTKRFIIQLKDKPIGFIGLYDIHDIHRVCSLGLYIGEKQEWGKGYASKAYKTIEEFAKNNLNIRKIKLEVVEDNKNAVLMYEKLGFKQCGKLIQERYIEGNYRNLIIMEKFI